MWLLSLRLLETVFGAVCSLPLSRQAKRVLRGTFDTKFPLVSFSSIVVMKRLAGFVVFFFIVRPTTWFHEWMVGGEEEPFNAIVPRFPSTHSLAYGRSFLHFLRDKNKTLESFSFIKFLQLPGDESKRMAYEWTFLVLITIIHSRVYTLFPSAQRWCSSHECRIHKLFYRLEC